MGDHRIEFRREWSNVGGRRSLSCYSAICNGLHLTIERCGGFCTVRHFVLTAEVYQRTRLVVTFYSFAEAQAFADDLANGGATINAHMLTPAYI